jgi:hypothetical protein
MKMRTIKVTPEFLMERLQGKTSTLTSNLPSDTELLDIKCDLGAGQVIAVVRSESFEDVADAYPIPEFVVTYSAAPKTATPLTALLKPEVKSTATTPKPEPVAVKKMPTPRRQDTSLMEEEFSEEQRKLLRFTVDGEYLVVKPVKFLKNEWDDINDTVRSLGGRWVKGDIISYWEVPLPPT